MDFAQTRGESSCEHTGIVTKSKVSKLTIKRYRTTNEEGKRHSWEGIDTRKKRGKSRSDTNWVVNADFNYDESSWTSQFITGLKVPYILLEHLLTQNSTQKSV